MSVYELSLTAHQLVNSTHMGNIEDVKKIIDSGIHPDDYGTNSMPAIVCSSMNGYYELTKYLLNKGASANNYTSENLSALKSAAKHKYFDICKLLLEHDADPNYEKNGNVALTLACDGKCEKEGNKELIELLLPVTDKKYYQLAYSNCDNPDIREIIKNHGIELEFTDPKNGFGSNSYKQSIVYETPPTDPIYLQVWDLLEIYIQNMKDPNRAMMAIFGKMGLGGCTDTVVLDTYEMDIGTAELLDVVFSCEWASKEDYPEIYKLVQKSIQDFENYESSEEQ